MKRFQEGHPTLKHHIKIADSRQRDPCTFDYMDHKILFGLGQHTGFYRYHYKINHLRNSQRCWLVVILDALSKMFM